MGGWLDQVQEAGLVRRDQEAARELANEGLIEITQRGVVLDPTASWRGPIRVRLPRSDDADSAD